MNSQFTLEKTLINPHHKPINCIAFDSSSTLLVTCSDDSKAIIWDYYSSKQLHCISLRPHGPIIRVLWFTDEEAVESTLLFGCADGTIHSYSWDGEVMVAIRVETAIQEAINYMSYHHHVLMVAAGPSVYAWQFSLIQKSKELWNYTHKTKAIARATHFVEEGSKLLVLFLDSHEVTFFHSRMGKIIISHRLRHRNGSSAISHDGHYVAIGNLMTGVDVYDTSTMMLCSTLQIPNRINVTKQLSFLGNSQYFVSGTDHGIVTISDVFCKEIVELKHGCRLDVTQVTDAVSMNGVTRIAVGSFHLKSGRTIVTIWHGRLTAAIKSAYWSITKCVLWALVIFAMFALLISRNGLNLKVIRVTSHYFLYFNLFGFRFAHLIGH